MHALRVEPPSESPSEEKTEPFSQSEIDTRLRSFRVEEANSAAALSENGAVHLDDLVVPQDKGIRILVRPLTRSRSVSPGNHDNCEWLALRAEVARPEQPEHKVLAVTQTSKDINFSVRIPGETVDQRMRRPLWCELYYDPASDNQIFLNRSDIPIALTRVSQHPAASPGMEYTVNPGTTKALIPGTWRIKADETDVLDFRILEKRPATLGLPSGSSSTSSLSDMVNPSGKRSFVADDEGGDDNSGPDKKPRTTETTARTDDGVVMFMRPGVTNNPLVFPLPTAARSKDLVGANGHPILEMQKDDIVNIPGGCEIDTYQLKKKDPIASTALSSVFTGEHSDVPDNIITVKVLKTRPANNVALIKPQETERNVIRQADIWLREYQMQEHLQHDSIVRLYGGDARYLSLYMEHIDARDLSAKGMWRTNNGDYFTGTRADATRILRDIAGALNYIHGRNLVHNDIKPANILYNRERGAVLCDFGLSTQSNKPATTGGTPYYVPPEFIGRKLRGAPSDVWALGITMLYVLRKISFPDARGRQTHARPLYWMIADLNRPMHHRSTAAGGSSAPSAVQQMQVWLSEINEAKDRLNLADKLERLVAEMLVPNPNQRITMRRLMAELFCDADKTG